MRSAQFLKLVFLNIFKSSFGRKIRTVMMNILMRHILRCFDYLKKHLYTLQKELATSAGYGNGFEIIYGNKGQ